MSDLYMLDGHTPVRCEDVRAWGRWFEETERRRVRWTELPSGEQISTVFLGMDHQHGDAGPPLLFETMISGGEWADWQDRCSTWEEAEAMHAAAVEMATRKGA
jgi:hypothetical protein